MEAHRGHGAHVQGQEAVYKEVAALVAGVMEGANGCVLAFGQSGSGKAHTLAGTPQHPGINFRAMSHLFRCAAHRPPCLVLPAQYLHVLSEVRASYCRSRLSVLSVPS